MQNPVALPTNTELSTWSIARLFTNWRIAEARLKHWHQIFIGSNPNSTAAEAADKYINFYAAALPLYYTEISTRVEDIPFEIIEIMINSGLPFSFNHKSIE